MVRDSFAFDSRECYRPGNAEGRALARPSNDNPTPLVQTPRTGCQPKTRAEQKVNIRGQSNRPAG
jgi:hypothetical protein